MKGFRRFDWTDEALVNRIMVFRCQSNMGVLYCIYDKLSYKIYIGITYNTAKFRFSTHLHDASQCKGKTHGVLHDYMRHVGIHNFAMKVLTKDEVDVDELEKYMIGKYHPELNVHFRTGWLGTRKISVCKTRFEQLVRDCETKEIVFEIAAEQKRNRRRWMRRKSILSRDGRAEVFIGDPVPHDGEFVRIVENEKENLLTACWTNEYHGSVTDLVNEWRCKSQLADALPQ